ncbi:MAG: hypothetical protein US82_C0023G0011 [Parcubacteria group bacterium GW2011_GWC1_38_22]|nr:MAG: hypothetical protein US82_C0023G0011 [Parcubacteria group bacterium GW2011_GWC1_38_22]
MILLKERPQRRSFSVRNHVEFALMQRLRRKLH